MKAESVFAGGAISVFMVDIRPDEGDFQNEISSSIKSGVSGKECRTTLYIIYESAEPFIANQYLDTIYDFPAEHWMHLRTTVTEIGNDGRPELLSINHAESY